MTKDTTRDQISLVGFSCVMQSFKKEVKASSEKKEIILDIKEITSWSINILTQS